MKNAQIDEAEAYVMPWSCPKHLRVGVDGFDAAMRWWRGAGRPEEVELLDDRRRGQTRPEIQIISWWHDDSTACMRRVLATFFPSQRG